MELRSDNLQMVNLYARWMTHLETKNKKYQVKPLTNQLKNRILAKIVSPKNDL
jgi:hypothetical protein